MWENKPKQTQRYGNDSLADYKDMMCLVIHRRILHFMCSGHHRDLIQSFDLQQNIKYYDLSQVKVTFPIILCTLKLGDYLLKKKTKKNKLHFLLRSSLML